jgi:hypothetical protein
MTVVFLYGIMASKGFVTAKSKTIKKIGISFIILLVGPALGVVISDSFISGVITTFAALGAIAYTLFS